MTTRKSSNPATKPARPPALPAHPKGASAPGTMQRPARKPVLKKPDATSAPTTASAGGGTSPSPAAKKNPKTERVAKQKETRVSLEFRLPKEERDALRVLKQRARKMEPSVKKSILLRAAIKTLMSMPDADLLAAIKVVKFD